MKNTKKKLVVICLALALLLVGVIGTTIAYFTDTENTQNIMIVGNVDITMNEAFTENEILLPAVYAADMDNAAALAATIPNEITKTIDITNNGTVDVYARTVLALRDNGSVVEGNYVPGVASKIHLVYGASGIVTEEVGYAAMADGNYYRIVVVTYTAAIEPIATSPDGLVKFYLDRSVDQDALDGIIDINNLKTDDNYDIYVLAQAVQADGFTTVDETPVATVALDAAFGDATTAQATTWFTTIITAP